MCCHQRSGRQPRCRALSAKRQWGLFPSTSTRLRTRQDKPGAFLTPSRYPCVNSQRERYSERLSQSSDLIMYGVRGTRTNPSDA